MSAIDNSQHANEQTQQTKPANEQTQPADKQTNSARKGPAKGPIPIQYPVDKEYIKHLFSKFGEVSIHKPRKDVDIFSVSCKFHNNSNNRNESDSEFFISSICLKNDKLFINLDVDAYSNRYYDFIRIPEEGRKEITTEDEFYEFVFAFIEQYEKILIKGKKDLQNEVEKTNNRIECIKNLKQAFGRQN